MIIGANPAENHPISFRWLLKAKAKGAKILSVDPRYTRSSTQADYYAPMRSGTDIAFMGGLINYTLENNLFHKEYVANYTNASFLVVDEFDFNDGIFSGYDEDTRTYDRSTWTFQTDEDGNIKKDLSLQHPRSVFQLLKKHFSRYDVETVTAVTGTPKDQYMKIAEEFCSTGTAEKTGTIMYAMGTTQHTVGTENVRSYAILQLLLGNVGRPGGGVNALRGESNVQGSTDFALLYHQLPGYLNSPKANKDHATLDAWIKKETPATGYWANKPKFMVSLLKAYYGKNATKDNEFCYQYLPKYEKDHSHIPLFESVINGTIKGMFCFGQNPAVGGPNALQEKNGLANLDWLVVADLWEHETASFWQPEAGANPAEINTEVFFLPACGSYEKEGTITNSGRWIQYRWQGIKPKGESRADLDIVHQIARRVKKVYANGTAVKDKAVQALDWNYGNTDHCDIDLVQREINGTDTKTGKLLKNFTVLADDGSTCSGNWIYSGFYPEDDKNFSKSRDNSDDGMGNFLNWSFSWPVNRRILYNRASADLNGKPWAEDKKVIWWDGKEWTGYDVPDFGKTKAPSDPGGKDPFIMPAHGVGNVFGPQNEGPFPEHYEPYESPVPNAFSSVQLNPAVVIWGGDHNPKGEKEQYPIVCTTYRLTEHWQSGAMTRNQPGPSELMPYMFVEMSEELAAEKGIKNKDKILIRSARAEIPAYAMVTKRFKPYNIRGQKVHHVGMPWHFGYKGYATGGTANRLTPHIGDANTTMPEYKAFLCDIRRAD